MSHKLTGRTALVTGASSGIGESLARELAGRGASLIITARRGERLEALARELREAHGHHGVAVRVIAIDLGQPGAARALFAQTEEAGQSIDILVNNAGAGTCESFFDIPWQRTAQQIQLNVLSLTELTYLFGTAMRTRGSGYVLNVSSIGAFVPTPYMATYTAGKAFVRDFTEAVAEEMKGSGVRFSCLCPGSTATEFSEHAGQDVDSLAVRLVTMSARRCARIGLDALLAGRRNLVSGYLNTLTMFLLRFVPRRLMIYVSGLIFNRIRRQPTAP